MRGGRRSVSRRLFLRSGDGAAQTGAPVSGAIREIRPAALSLEDVLEAIAAAAAALNVEAYLVGGFVRDRLLGGPASKDIDLVTVATDPMPLLAVVANAFGWHPPERFERFGTAQIRGPGFVIGGRACPEPERYDPESPQSRTFAQDRSNKTSGGAISR